MAIASGATYADLESSLRFRLADAMSEVREDRGQLVVGITRESRPQALQALKDLGFTYHVFVAGVDWPDDAKFEVLDHVYSLERRQRVTLRCDVPYADPKVPTGAGVYRGCDWHERETWELFGIVFTGHPRLQRLLLPDWFEGFPMRKDYELPARVEKPWPGEFFEG